MIEKKEFWSTPIWSTSLKLDNQKLGDDILKLSEKFPSVHKSNFGGWQSDNLIGTDVINDLHFEILKYTNEIVDKQNKLNQPMKTLYVDQIWANVNKKNDYNEVHQHGDYILSGIYYVRTPENCGELVIRDPRDRALSGATFYYSMLDNELLYIKPKAGALILFPCFLDHWVRPNKSDKERISISFDLKWPQ